MEHLTHFFLHKVEQAGYPGLFLVMLLGNIGIPVGTELMVAAAGAFAGAGKVFMGAGGVPGVWLVAAVAAANPHTIVVLEPGGPVTMPWIAQVSGVLEAWYPGIGGAQALAAMIPTRGDTQPNKLALIMVVVVAVPVVPGCRLAAAALADAAAPA